MLLRHFKKFLVATTLPKVSLKTFLVSGIIKLALKRLHIIFLDIKDRILHIISLDQVDITSSNDECQHVILHILSLKK